MDQELAANATVLILNKLRYEADRFDVVLQGLGLPQEHIYKVTTLDEAKQRLAQSPSCDLFILDCAVSGDPLTWFQGYLSDLTQEHRPACLVTYADPRRPDVLSMMARGETDCVGRFWHEEETAGRITQLLTGHILKQHLTLQVQKRTKQLELAVEELVSRLADAIEGRDTSTGQHAHRMSLYAEALGRCYIENPREGDEELTEEQLPLLRQAALLHDIGKLAVPDTILKGTTELTPEEFGIVKKHPATGSRILKNSKLLELRWACVVALTHQEKWNGKGYPQGLREMKIPLIGRIVAIADVFDAMTGPRSYKEPTSPDTLLDQFRSGKWEGHFDPHLLTLFLGIKEKIKAIHGQYPNPSEIHSDRGGLGCDQCQYKQASWSQGRKGFACTGEECGEGWILEESVVG